MSKTGRPTKYTPELLKKAQEYLENFKTEHNHTVPSVVGLCKVLKISKSTAYKLAEEEGHEAFSDTLQDIQTYQEFELVNGGLSNQLNSTITKLMLANHGYHDKQDVHTPDGVAFNMNFGGNTED